MRDDDGPDVEASPLCRQFTQDGISVHVEIYRLRGVGGGWTLEVVDHEDTSTIWDEAFATDQEAYDEFLRTVETEGIRSFLELPPETLH